MIILIHIGKCGGSSLISALKGNVKVKHIQMVTWEPNSVIIIRNPVQRFISAFNWRFHLVVEKGQQQDRFPGEKELLLKGIHAFIKNPIGYIHHIHEDIYFYLNQFDFTKPVKIITTENLKADALKILNVNVDVHLNQNKKETIVDYDTLKKYLIIEKMKHLLSEEQYNNLSN